MVNNMHWLISVNTFLLFVYLPLAQSQSLSPSPIYEGQIQNPEGGGNDDNFSKANPTTQPKPEETYFFYSAMASFIFIISCAAFIMANNKFIRKSHFWNKRIFSNVRIPPVNVFDSWSLNVRQTIFSLKRFEGFIIILYGLAIAFTIYFGRMEIERRGSSGDFVFGHVLSLHIAIGLLPVSRNSLFVSLIVNSSFDRLIKYHRWIMRAGFVFLLAHFITAFLHYGQGIFLNDFLTHVTVNGSRRLWGVIAGSVMFLIYLFSIESIRRKSYEFFYYSHVLLWPLVVAISMVHSKFFIYSAAPPICMCVLDRLIRMFMAHYGYSQNKISTGATVTFFAPLEPHGITSVFNDNTTNNSSSQKKKNGCIIQLDVGSHFKYSEGQFIFINVPSISSFQWHPFSITSAPIRKYDYVNSGPNIDDKPNPFTLHILSMGHPDDNSFTQQLCQLAILNQNKSLLSTQHKFGVNVQPLLASEGNKIVTDNYVNHQGQPLTVRVEGPYGSHGVDLSDYSVLILVGGGIGVTPLISLMTALMREKKLRRKWRRERKQRIESRMNKDNYSDNKIRSPSFKSRGEIKPDTGYSLSDTYDHSVTIDGSKHDSYDSIFSKYDKERSRIKKQKKGPNWIYDKIKAVHFVWVVQHSDAIRHWFPHRLAQIEKMKHFHFHLFVTKTNEIEVPISSSADNSSSGMLKPDPFENQGSCSCLQNAENPDDDDISSEEEHDFTNEERKTKQNGLDRFDREEADTHFHDLNSLVKPPLPTLSHNESPRASLINSSNAFRDSSGSDPLKNGVESNSISVFPYTPSLTASVPGSPVTVTHSSERKPSPRLSPTFGALGHNYHNHNNFSYKKNESQSQRILSQTQKGSAVKFSLTNFVDQSDPKDNENTYNYFNSTSNEAHAQAQAPPSSSIPPLAHATANGSSLSSKPTSSSPGLSQNLFPYESTNIHNSTSSTSSDPFGPLANNNDNTYFQNANESGTSTHSVILKDDYGIITTTASPKLKPKSNFIPKQSSSRSVTVTVSNTLPGSFGGDNITQRENLSLPGPGPVAQHHRERVSLQTGRPDFISLFKRIADHHFYFKPHKVCVMASGPDALVSDVDEAASKNNFVMDHETFIW